MTQHQTLLQIVDIPYFARQKCAFTCDAYQSSLFYSATKRTILNCSRQVGKSTIAALKAVQAAYHRPKSTILVTSPTKQQSRELIRKIRTFAYLSGSSLRGGKESVDFKNGSRVLAVAADEDTVRGFSAVTLLIIDEAARVNDEVYFALLPSLAVSGGSLWLLSTPKGKRGFFHAEWLAAADPLAPRDREPTQQPGTATSDRWAKLKITARECARIEPAFLERQKRRIGERRFLQDYECQFFDSGGFVFDPEVVRKAFTDKIKPLDL
jgi:hypothetical protein